MSATIYLTTICLPLATILLVFGIRAFSAIQQAKARLASDQAYRQVAETAATVQAETSATLASIQATLTDVRTRLSTIETVLKAVE